MKKRFERNALGELCPKCGEPMERRKHPLNFYPRTRYYFSEWDVCKTCKHVQHYKKYKVLSQHKNEIKINGSFFD